MVNGSDTDIIVSIISRLNALSIGNIERDMYIYGNAFWLWDGSSDIEVLDAKKVSTDTKGNLLYEEKDGKKKPIDMEQLIHFHQVETDKNGLGISPIVSITTSLNIDFWSKRAMLESEKAFGSIERYIVYFKNVLNQPSSIFKGLKDTTKDIDEWMNRTNDKDVRKGLVSPVEIGFNVVGGRDNKQFIPLQNWVVQEVSRALDIPTPLLSELTRGIYNNIDSLKRDWYQTSILGSLTYYQKIISDRMSEISGKEVVFAFNLQSVPEFNEDLDKKTDRLLKLLQQGLVTREFVQKELGLPEGEGEIQAPID